MHPPTPVIHNAALRWSGEAAGHHAGVVGDDYIRITVFLAAVLFLVGIGSTFKLHTIRYALIGVGSRWSPCWPGYSWSPAPDRGPRPATPTHRRPHHPDLNPSSGSSTPKRVNP